MYSTCGSGVGSFLGIMEEVMDLVPPTCCFFSEDCFSLGESVSLGVDFDGC